MFVWESLFPFTFKDNRNFTGYRILGWHFFFFQYLKMSLCCLLARMVSDEKSAVVHTLLPLLVRCFIFLWLPWRKLFVFVFFEYDMLRYVYGFVCVCLHLFCLVFIVCYWFWKILAIIFSNISFVVFFLFLLVFHLCTCYYLVLF